MKTLDELKANIQQFANEHKVLFEDNGECGFGRPCVGLLRDSNYIAYNPTDSKTNDEIPEFSDYRFYDIAPENAYHKSDCIAVLGTDEDSIRELSEWVDELRKLNVTVERYSTGATGMQAMFTGTFGYAVKIPK